MADAASDKGDAAAAEAAPAAAAAAEPVVEAEAGDTATPTSKGDSDDDCDVLERVRRSCAAFVRPGRSAAWVDDAAIEAWLRDADFEQLRELSKEGISRPPLKFPTLEAEVNYWAVLNLLNFGSGYRHELHALTDRGAYETMMFGVLGLFLGGCAFDANWMRYVSLHDVSTYFQLPLDHEVKVMAAVYESRPGPLRPLAERIMRVLNETGERLAAMNCPDIATFVLDESYFAGGGAIGRGPGEVEEKAATDRAPPSAARLVQRLVDAFPAFNDVHLIDAGAGGEAAGEGAAGGAGGAARERVWLCKKAQILAADLYRIFGETDVDTRLKFVDYDKLTALSDNVVPAVLRKLGIVRVTDELAELIDSRKELPPDAREVALRAAGVHACEKIVAAAGGKFATAADLDYALWKLGKVDDFRTFERHATRDTVYY